MKSCQRISCLLLLTVAVVLGTSFVNGAPSAEALPEPAHLHDEAKLVVIGDDENSVPPTQATNDPRFVVITEDVIPDVENTTQKVIRVNPLDLPPVKADAKGSIDSSLFKIQNLLPANRNYVNSNRMRRPRPFSFDNSSGRADSPIIRHLPDVKPHKPKQKKKHLHFLYNQETYDGGVVSKTMRVHVAPGAYPVYYAVSKTNGRFGKFPVKGFRDQEDFQKYLQKSKIQPIERTKRYDS